MKPYAPPSLNVLSPIDPRALRTRVDEFLYPTLIDPRYADDLVALLAGVAKDAREVERLAVVRALSEMREVFEKVGATDAPSLARKALLRELAEFVERGFLSRGKEQRRWPTW